MGGKDIFLFSVLYERVKLYNSQANAQTGGRLYLTREPGVADPLSWVAVGYLHFHLVGKVDNCVFSLPCSAFPG